jgi:hypothetical protein
MFGPANFLLILAKTLRPIQPWLRDQTFAALCWQPTGARMKSKISVFALGAMLASSLALAAGPGLKVGAARVEQTGPFGKSQTGQYDHEHVYARAIVLENAATRAALISYEGPQANFNMGATRRQIADSLRCPIENVLITHTHTHSSQSAPMSFGRGGPQPTTPSKEITDAVSKALAALKPARMAYGTGAAYLNVNRDAIDPVTRKWTQGTNLDAPSDRTVAVLLFIGADDRPIAAYVTYAMHPVDGFVLGVVTGDFAGAMSRYVEKAFGDDTVVAFAQSASGDQNPLYLRPSNNAMANRAGNPVTGFGIDRETSEGPLRMDPSKPAADPKSIDSLFRFIESEGQILGEEVIRVMTMSKGQSTDEVRIAGYQKSVVCPGRTRTNADPMDPKTREGLDATYTDAPSPDLRVGLLGLGSIALTSINTEIYTAIGLDIKARSPMKNTIIATLANERIGGYVPDDASFGHQTFQVLNSSFKPGCAQTGIVNAVVELQTRYVNGR